ncbi:MAG: molybdopterin-dependent oxidoreductase, partial [Spirochaetota bacterium]|nr:molybdopterin-dependent oxidoreductase [Spirochaetota bacterium]
LDSTGACRVCLVENEEKGNLVASCVTPISEGMSIRTDSQQVLDTRKIVVQLLLASHPDSCIVCEKGNRCKLRQIAADLGIGLIEYYPMPHFSGTEEVNPFILRDLSKCILCAKCIRADHELVVEGAIDYIDRGFEARPATNSNGPLETSNCTFCGTCVEMCPTGALFERNKRFQGTATKRVATTCPFCGCGCSYWLEVTDDQVVGVRPGVPGSANGMTICATGHYGYDLINHPDRLTNPLIRKNGTLEQCRWDEALKDAAIGLKKIKEKNGGESIAIMTGSHCTNEEAYLLKKIATDALNTKNIICSSSIYMTNLIHGMMDTLGFAGATASIETLEDADAIFLIGANPSDTAPVVGYSIKRGVRKKKTNLIVIDPIEIRLAEHARLWIRPEIASDEFILLCFLKLILNNKNFIEGLSIEKIDTIKKDIENIPLEKVEQVTGVPLESLREAADIFCSARKSVIVFGNGIIQQPKEKELVKILCTLVQLAPERIGILPLIKESNTMGCYHMGLVNGETHLTILNKIKNGQIKGLWIFGDDPLVSLPYAAEFNEALDNLEFLVVSDSYLTKSGEKAHLVLPSTTFAEKSGTLTNMEGYVKKINPAINSINENPTDFATLNIISDHLGFSSGCKSEKDATQEIIQNVELYSEMDISKMDDAYFFYALPVPSFKKDISLSIPDDILESPKPDNEYPYTLMQGSILFQLSHNHQTRFSTRLRKMIQDEYVEINPEDAFKEGIKENDIINLISFNGEKKIKAHLADRIPEGVLFLPFPFLKGSNILSFNREHTGYKTVKIKIERTNL